MIRYVAVTIFCVASFIEIILHPENINTVRLTFYAVIGFIVLLELIKLGVKCYFNKPAKEYSRIRYIWNGTKFVEKENDINKSKLNE